MRSLVRKPPVRATAVALKRWPCSTRTTASAGTTAARQLCRALHPKSTTPYHPGSVQSEPARRVLVAFDFVACVDSPSTSTPASQALSYSLRTPRPLVAQFSRSEPGII
eukprot:2557200-Rhodomonas_salina.3